MAGAFHEQRRVADAPAPAESGLFALLALLLAGMALGLLLWQIDKPPRIAEAPDWAHIRDVLTGSELAEADMIAAAAGVAWVALAYLLFTVGLRLLLVIADRLTGGARWARTGLRLSSLVTIPAVRRVVDGGVAGTLLLASWVPASPRAALAAEATPVATVSLPRTTSIAGLPNSATALQRDSQAQTPETFVDYTVVQGDHLWDIARRLYGDGSRFVEIFEANRGRVMPGGEAFNDPRLIRPGWVLHVPLPVSNLSVEEGTASYRVRRGDHLWGIAERFLGDGFRWVEIWELNRGREIDAGRHFSDPNLIHPGWLLELPIEIGDAAAPTQPSAPADPPPPVDPQEPPETTAIPPSVELPQNAAVSDDDDDGDGGWNWEWPSLPRPVVVTAAGFAVIGGTALFVRRLHSAGLLRLPRSAAGDRSGTGDAGRVALATRALSGALADLGFAEATPFLVLESGRRLTFSIACSADNAEALTALRPDLARRLACDVNVELNGSARVTLTLSRFQRLAGMLTDLDAPMPLIVPVGANADGIVYLNLEAAGSVAVAGTDGQRRQLVRSWLATLATTCSPEGVSFRVTSDTARFLELDEGLPHLAGAPDGDARDLAEELDEVIRSRESADKGHALLAVAELADGTSELFDGVLRYGPSAGVFTICGVPASESASDLERFGASVGFHAEDDASADETDTAPVLGTLMLAIGRAEPILLEPVHVRRDTSPRWTESAEVATFGSPFPRGRGEGPSFMGASDAALAPRTLAEVGQRAGVDDERHPANSAIEESRARDADVEAESPPAAAGTLDVAPPTSADVDEERGAEVAAEHLNPDPEDSLPAANSGTENAPRLPEANRRADRPQLAIRQAALLTDLDLEVPGAGRTEAQPPPNFIVSCLGRFEVRCGEVVVDRWTPEKSRELVAFLAAHGGNAVPREVVAEALWPGYTWDASLRHLLANAVSGVRSALRSAAANSGMQPITTARQRLQLQSGAVFRVDVDAFESSLRRASTLTDMDALEQYERAVALYRGEFLQGELFTWAEAYRGDYRQRLIDAARRGAALAERLEERQRAARLFQTVLDYEPADEDAVRGWMRQLGAVGDINGARKIYKALTEALQRELDDPLAAPAAETRALLADLVGTEGRGT